MKLQQPLSSKPLPKKDDIAAPDAGFHCALKWL
jgi:hypothetical protein